MSEEERIAKEDEVFDQELKNEELKDVSGGFFDTKYWAKCKSDYETDMYSCTQADQRLFWAHDNHNCAATVEDGSMCDNNDACLMASVVYYGMKNCKRSWD